MAIWQVSMILTNKDNNVINRENTLQNSLNDLNMYFPEEKSWCSSIRQFGKIDSTCMEIDCVTGEFFLRIDLRNITQEQLEMIIKFADANKLKIKNKNRLEDPTFNNFINVFKMSNAYRYVKNPKEYFNTMNL